MTKQDIAIYETTSARRTPPESADPITTEVMRHALNSAANQMKRALIRTAFSPIIYEVLDFAVAIYDRDIRLLAQAPTLPMFMGTMNFCIEGALEGIGGPSKLKDGDVILYNWPFGTGAHAQDLCVIMPVFFDGELAGYVINKAHWNDIAAKDPYSTDTVDVYQEGVIYPGVKLYEAGVLNEGLQAVVLTNTRVPKAIKGDLNAQVVSCRAGVAGFEDVLRRFGRETFEASIELMLDHGEKVMRSYLEKIPDGVYSASGALDNDGITDTQVPFEISISIKGSEIEVDFTASPDETEGPFNCPLPCTVALSRVAMTLLAGFGEPPNEGQFRPVRVKTRPGSMFHPLPPAPSFLYYWAALQAVEVIHAAIGKAQAELVPADSGGCIASLTWWGKRTATGNLWAEGAPHPVGQGASAHGDGGTMLFVTQSGTRLAPMEVWESRNPWIIEKLALAPDSGGAGKYRGGPGLDLEFRLLEDSFITPVVERTQNQPQGSNGGAPGRANGLTIRKPSGEEVWLPKYTRYALEAGSLVSLSTGGGGGYGDPSERTAEAVLADVRNGFVTEEQARRDYPHAFAD
ncbi:hydantoinase B/oxoprolinase family protein [Psychromarinibacter halotolerans]|uniref:Hydantoinase B/oxoprolinase family protein n=1 Tax=Psychromarinibacter halotolerans TaxID=1775175 RepID=A0ABV7GMF8_9RHOB|nr:hydantoinase B/oxoprolinase family protein [Psychromarinibacter halotolerans]MDF0597395.1 hydantoinase B/oxoprolinase family protein [Psychromarinibacter halotolerans]